MDSWRPKISFGIENNKLYILLKYFKNNISIFLKHGEWDVNTEEFYMLPYDQIQPALTRYLHTDLKNRPAVRDFLKSGPPGADMSDSVDDLVKMIVGQTRQEYYNFAQQY